MYAIGIDVSKGKSTVAINFEGKLLEKPFNIEHTEDGVNELLTKLDGAEKNQVKFVMEATGVYHLPLLTKLLEFDFFVCVENAFLMKKYFDVGLRKVKTDKKDAIKIAKYCIDNWSELRRYSLQDSVYEDLKFLSRQYSQQIALKVKAKVQFSNLLEVTFPNFNTVFHDNQYFFMLDVYEKYPHPSTVRELVEEDFVEDIEKLAKKRGHRIGLRVGLELYALAKKIIPTRPYNKYTQLAATTCANSLRTLEQATEDIIAQMDDLAKELPEYDVVGEMGGVGRKLRPRIIAEIGDVRKYNKAGSLIATAGLDTPPYESGNFKADNVHISKRGNKYLRKCGYEIVKCLKSSKPKTDVAVYEYVIKKELEGKPLRVSKIAGLNKFLRIYYARVMEIYQ
jgi:transposase